MSTAISTNVLTYERLKAIAKSRTAANRANAIRAILFKDAEITGNAYAHNPYYVIVSANEKTMTLTESTGIISLSAVNREYKNQFEKYMIPVKELADKKREFAMECAILWDGTENGTISIKHVKNYLSSVYADIFPGCNIPVRSKDARYFIRASATCKPASLETDAVEKAGGTLFNVLLSVLYHAVNGLDYTITPSKDAVKGYENAIKKTMEQAPKAIEQ